MGKNFLRPGSLEDGPSTVLKKGGCALRPDEPGGPRDGEPDPQEFLGRPLGREAVSRLYEAYSTKLIDILVVQLRLLRTPEVVEDAVADVFTELFARAEGPRPLVIEKDPFRFLLRSVRNRIADKAPMEIREREAVRNSDAFGSKDLADAAQRQPLSHLVAAEVLAVTRQALETLSDEERQAFQLVRQEGLSGEEAARRLALSDAALRRALGRAERAIDDYRARYWSTFVRHADSFTYKPRGRKAAIAAFLTFPKDSREVLTERYVHRTASSEAACKLGLSSEAYAERLKHAEGLFEKRFGLKVPEELEKVLAEGGGGSLT